MRAKDFLVEKQGKLDKDHVRAMPGLSVYPGMNYYDQYRLGMAMAGAPENYHHTPKEGPFGPRLVTIGYTQTDQHIIDKAIAQGPFKKVKKSLTSPGSNESADTNVASPVSKFKGHKKIKESMSDDQSEERSGNRNLLANVDDPNLPGAAQALPATFIFPDLQNQDPYRQYRFGLAIAAANAAAKYGIKYNVHPTFGENLIIVARSEAEEEQIKTAQKIFGGASKSITISTRTSDETSGTNIISPVAVSRNKTWTPPKN